MIFRLISAFFEAARVLSTNRSAQSLILKPYFIGLGSTCASIVLFFLYREQAAAALFGDSWLLVTSTLFFLIGIMVSSLIGLLATLLFKEFYLPQLLEVLVAERLSDVPRTKLSLSTSIFEIAYRLCFLAVLTIVSLVSFFVPAFALVPLLIGAWYVGQDSVMSTLSVLGLPLRQQLSTSRRRFFEVFCLGLICWLLLLIPLAGILFVPFTYLVGLEVVKKWNERKLLDLSS